MIERWRDEHGETLVSYALVVPFFLLVVFGIMELGRVVSAYSTISNAAREGARYGIVWPTDGVGIENAARAKATNLDPANLQVTSTQNGITVCVTVDYDIDLVSAHVISALGVGPTWGLNAKATMRVE